MKSLVIVVVLVAVKIFQGIGFMGKTNPVAFCIM